LAALCGKLGAFQHGQTVEARHSYLRRGTDILLRLKSAGHLMASQETVIQWFDEQLAKLDGHHS
jgi:hypothetical protein